MQLTEEVREHIRQAMLDVAEKQADIIIEHFAVLMDKMPEGTTEEQAKKVLELSIDNMFKVLMAQTEAIGKQFEEQCKQKEGMLNVRK